jgi:GNAT superfamily N-acetyltransferase
MIEIKAAGPSDWEASKAIRLRALADSPDVFESTLEQEAAFDDNAWIYRLEGAHQLIAWDDDEPVGTVTGLPNGDMVAVWVAPEYRGTGLSDRLVNELAEWGRAAGLAELRIWVVDGNEAGRRLYERTGFMPNGEAAVMRDGIAERRMSRAL